MEKDLGVNVLYVLDSAGRKITDPEKIDELQRELLQI